MAGTPTTKKRILLVDDDEDLCFVISRLLRSHHFAVDVAHNGRDGLAQCLRRPDLVLLDRSLPDMDGLEICRQVRADRRLRHIPVVMLTALDKSLEKIEGLYSGADDYITKPFDQEELLARLAAVLRRHELSREARKEQGEMIRELRRILDERLITPFFQPIFDLERLEPIGFEVLSRPPLDSPLNNPDILFKTALGCGMYFELEMHCWRTALDRWVTLDLPHKLFLNGSPYLIEHDRFDETILLECGGDPSRVVLELTERMAIVDYASFMAKIDRLKKLKVSITVDDVGCGFASLDTVVEVKPDFLKIDMPLIRGVHEDSMRRHIVEAVVAFCRKCGIVSIVEGIEEMGELRTVREIGAHAGQGFLLGRPADRIETRCAVAFDETGPGEGERHDV